MLVFSAYAGCFKNCTCWSLPSSARACCIKLHLLLHLNDIQLGTTALQISAALHLRKLLPLPGCRGKPLLEHRCNTPVLPCTSGTPSGCRTGAPGQALQPSPLQAMLRAPASSPGLQAPWLLIHLLLPSLSSLLESALLLAVLYASSPSAALCCPATTLPS